MMLVLRSARGWWCICSNVHSLFAPEKRCAKAFMSSAGLSTFQNFAGGVQRSLDEFHLVSCRAFLGATYCVVGKMQHVVCQERGEEDV